MKVAVFGGKHCGDEVGRDSVECDVRPLLSREREDQLAAAVEDERRLRPRVER